VAGVEVVVEVAVVVVVDVELEVDEDEFERFTIHETTPTTAKTAITARIANQSDGRRLGGGRLAVFIAPPSSPISPQTPGISTVDPRFSAL
jgi:hypothetical protein